MYAALPFDVNAGPEPIAHVRNAVVDVFKDRLTCDLPPDTLICAIDDTADYLAIVTIPASPSPSAGCSLD